MKVLIVRYIRNPDNYFFDLFDAASAGLLTRAGHEVAVVERMLAEGFDEDDVLEGLYRFAVDYVPDLIFLSYTPLVELPAALRERTGATLVATGSQLLLNAGIDYVLTEPDPLALVQLADAVAGRRPPETVAALSWLEGGEVRRSDIGLHSIFDIFTQAPIAYDAFYRLGPGRPVELRKHVVADWGCPYRHAPSSTPPPSGAPSWVPTGGCTFCTRPGWENSDWDVQGPVVGQQMDRVLAAFPDLAKLIVIDEHGLAHADDIARLVKARPMEGIEILLSGRLDHVRRHKERLLEALSLLKETNTVRLYQFGIENLADSVLRRYNKGLSAAEIGEALKLMGGLAKSHANLAIEQSFGFIMFDPWTTVHELRTNVTRARALGLDHYRGQAPFTALRLVPEMPLYWRAKSEGLLTQDLADNVFGYSANAGWQFADPAVADVYAELTTRRGEMAPWSLLAAVVGLP